MIRKLVGIAQLTLVAVTVLFSQSTASAQVGACCQPCGNCAMQTTDWSNAIPGNPTYWQPVYGFGNINCINAPTSFNPNWTPCGCGNRRYGCGYHTCSLYASTVNRCGYGLGYGCGYNYGGCCSRLLDPAWHGFGSGNFFFPNLYNGPTYSGGYGHRRRGCGTCQYSSCALTTPSCCAPTATCSSCMSSGSYVVQPGAVPGSVTTYGDTPTLSPDAPATTSPAPTVAPPAEPTPAPAPAAAPSPTPEAPKPGN